MTKEELEKKEFLTEIINSKFNLITDQEIKKRIISILGSSPEKTLPEVILKSYLYLIMGNITRSDNLLKEFILSPPRVNWERIGLKAGFIHVLAKEQMLQLIKKMAKHPADRKVFGMLMLYLQNYYNDPALEPFIDEANVSEVEKKINLRYVENISPSFVHFLRMQDLEESKRIISLRDQTKYPVEEQSYWMWAFLDIDPLVSVSMNNELLRLEKEDELWFIYLMSNEKIADAFSSKSGRGFLPGRRPFLKEGLNSDREFMMSLYKLIEIGDINQDLVQRTVNKIVYE